MNPTRASNPLVTVDPKDVHTTIGKYMLADGEHLVIDLAGSHGPYLRDAATGREYLDFYAYFASQPIGHNHPKLREPWFVQRMARRRSTIRPTRTSTPPTWPSSWRPSPASPSRPTCRTCSS